MDFINKAWTQIVDVFKSLTPGTRIAVGLLAVAVVVGLFYLFQYQATGSNEYLLGGRSFVAEELTKAEADFAKAGLTHWEVVDGGRIRVPQGKKSLYLAALGDSGRVGRQRGECRRRHIPRAALDHRRTGEHGRGKQHDENQQGDHRSSDPFQQGAHTFEVRASR